MEALIGAERAAGALDRARQLLDIGGPVVWILLALAVFALGVVLAKLWQFAVSGLGDRRAAEDALALKRAGRMEDAQARAARSRHPAARALALALEGERRRLPEARVREEAARVAEDELEALREWLRPLEVIAALSPLLGLFGTVLGMIDAFAALEAAGARVDPAILSGGIWVALLTTAVGLAVAMPTVAALAWLERRIERAERAVDSALAGAFAAQLDGSAADPSFAGQAHDGLRVHPA
jgi:biopolymer transport protein ExbB